MIIEIAWLQYVMILKLKSTLMMVQENNLKALIIVEIMNQFVQHVPMWLKVTQSLELQDSQLKYVNLASKNVEIKDIEVMDYSMSITSAGWDVDLWKLYMLRSPNLQLWLLFLYFL